MLLWLIVRSSVVDTGNEPFSSQRARNCCDRCQLDRRVWWQEN
jgi:hypothetical protein